MSLEYSANHRPNRVLTEALTVVWADNPIHGQKVPNVGARKAIHKVNKKMKAIQWNPRAIFGSVVMSRRHVEIGTIEDTDFGSVELIAIPEAEKQLIVSFKDGDKQHEFVELDGMVYERMHEIHRLSRADSEALLKTQGRMSEKVASGIALKVRNSMANTFLDPGKVIMLLVGKVLYRQFGKPSKLVVNTCGNLSFSYWLSVDIEWDNPNKQSYPCHKSSFEAVVKDARKTFNANKPEPGSKRGDGHVHFSYPTSVKWGANYSH